MELLNWLQNWYENNCDGNWEHMFGIKIDTLDNPGWTVDINLEDTNLEGKNFTKVQYDNGNRDWLTCLVKDDMFSGAGDPQKLEKILTIFKEWTETK